MSVAVQAPSHHISSGHSMMSSSAPRLQARPPSASSSTQQRTMAPRPSATIQARPSLPSSASSSSKSVSKPTPTPASTPRPMAHSRTSSTSSVTTPPAAPAVASKDTSSSAGKIFAKPSKEWVLPERAKPGRKVSVEEPDNKRQSQNRLSQRAHRARRTDYIQTLEERLRQYEADEIHSNVRLQEVARALKADNERLRNEVVGLKTTCAEYSAEKSTWEIERRSLQENMIRMKSEMEGLRSGRGVQTIVRMEVDQEEIDRLVPGPSLPRRTSTSSSIPIIATQQRALVDCPICPNPDPDCPCQQSEPQQAFTSARDPTLAPSEHEHEPSSSCGFCHSTEECLCRVVEEDIKPDISSSSPSKSFKPDEGCGLCTSSSFCACRAVSDSPSTSSIKGFISSNTSTVVQTTTSGSTAALPLRLRARSGAAKSSIWSLTTSATPAAAPAPAPTLRPKEAVCTGDPSNCDACRNDSFGREFCQHLFESTDDASGTVKPCTQCPGNCMSIKSLLSPSPDQNAIASSSRLRSSIPVVFEEETMPLAPLQMACCGNPELCGGHHGTGCTGEVVALGGMSAAQDEPKEFEAEDHTTLRPDQAWKTLKAHPNAKFASLALLADVVARRTKSLNEQMESDSIDHSPSNPLSSNINATTSTAGHVPTIHPGVGLKKRTLEVETSGLRDALRLLDRATPTPSAASPVLDGERTLKKRKVVE